MYIVLNTELLKSRDHKPWRESKLKVKSFPVCGCVRLYIFSADGQASLYFPCLSVDVWRCVYLLQMDKPACPFIHLQTVLPQTALPELRINYLGGISGSVAGNAIQSTPPPGFLCNPETLISEPCFLISNFIQMWWGGRGEEVGESYEGQKGEGRN